jgi:hypothetical protein
LGKSSKWFEAKIFGVTFTVFVGFLTLSGVEKIYFGASSITLTAPPTYSDIKQGPNFDIARPFNPKKHPFSQFFAQTFY